jgi:hypothetical protein
MLFVVQPRTFRLELNTRNPRSCVSWQCRTEGGFNRPPPKLRSFEKGEPNSKFRGKYIRNNLIRIRVSLICKLSGTPDQGDTAHSSPFSLPSVLN